MIPEAFSYHQPRTLADAVGLLREHGEEAKVLAGGHSLIPAMKLRLVRPRVIVDVGKIAELSAIESTGESVRVGAMVTHATIMSSALLLERCPLLPETARHIGDLQVRNKGTIGGSLVHADPAADWPGVALALEASLEISGPRGKRTVNAADFFVDMLQTVLEPDEILFAVTLPSTARSVAYVKTEQKASGFALCGVGVVIDARSREVRIGLNGVSAVPYRAAAAETLLAGQDLTPARIADAARVAGAGVEPLADIHASAEYRLHLATVNTRRALERAAAAV